MSGLAIVTMAVICLIVWGGFLTLLITALKRERSKTVGRDATSSEDATDERGSDRR